MNKDIRDITAQSWKQHLVYVQVNINRAVFEFNKADNDNRELDTDYLIRCIEDAERDLRIAKTLLTGQTELFK